MSDAKAAPSSPVMVTFGDRQLIAPVLERIVGAAAVQAELPVDRLVNALAAVDALVNASAKGVPDDIPQAFSVGIESGRLRLAIDGLEDARVEAILHATRIPQIGDVLGRVAESVATIHGEDGASLVVTLC